MKETLIWIYLECNNSIMLPVNEYTWIVIHLNSTNFIYNKWLNIFVRSVQWSFFVNFLAYIIRHKTRAIFLHILIFPFLYFNICTNVRNTWSIWIYAARRQWWGRWKTILHCRRKYGSRCIFYVLLYVKIWIFFVLPYFIPHLKRYTFLCISCTLTLKRIKGFLIISLYDM